MRRWPYALAVVGAIVFVATGTPVTIAGGTAGQGEQTVDLVLTEYAFGPSDPVVTAGNVTVRVVNAGIRRHNVVLLVDDVERASPEARPGDVVDWEVQIDSPGHYLFWCGEYRHLEKGMTGTLRVESAAALDPPS